MNQRGFSKGLDQIDFWEPPEPDIREYTEPPFTQDQLRAVESELGYKLPPSHVALMQIKNGGIPKRTCHPASPTSWADDHVALDSIKGIGRTSIWSLCGELGGLHAIREWGYPTIGVYFGECPSGGHDMICLDYRDCGPTGEPGVVHVDQDLDYRITPLAENFEAFILALQPEEAFE